MSKSVKLMVMLLTLGAELAYDQVPYGTEFRIGFQEDCREGPVFLQPLVDSGYAVLWKRQRPHASSYDLMVKTLRDKDSTAVSTVAVTSGTVKSFLQPNLLTLEGGGFVVGWSESASPLAGSYLNVHFYSREGQETGTPVRLYHPYSPDRLWIFAAQGQTVEISWYVYEMGIDALVGQLAGPNADQFSAEYTIFDFRHIGYVAPEQARLTNGYRVLCWRVNDSEQGEQAAALLSAQGAEIRRWTLPPSWHPFEYNLQAVSLAQGKFVILGSSNQYSNFAQFYSPDGMENASLLQPLKSPWPAAPLLKTFAVSLGETGCLIYGGKASSSTMGIVGQYFTNDGIKIHDQFTFHGTQKSTATPAQACSGHKSDLLIAWYTAGSCGTIVLAERMPSPLRPIPPAEFHCLAPANDSYLNTDHVTLRWQSAAPSPVLYPWEVLSYSVAVSNDPDSGFVRVAENKTDTTHTLANLKGGRTYFWKILAKNSYGDSLWSSNVNAFFVSYSVHVTENEYSRPQTVRLLQNHPNPFNPTTAIHYALSMSATVNIKIFNLQGRLVKPLFSGKQQSGDHTVGWDGRDDHDKPVAAGVYIYQIEAVDATGKKTIQSKKMSLVK